MGMPKSVTKVKKDGVTFVSSVDRCEYTIQELSKAALRDTAKFLRKKIKDNAPKKSGNLKKNIGTWVRKDRNTGDVSLHIGVYDRAAAKKKGLKYAFYAQFFEFGTSKRAAFNGGRGFIRPHVMDNIDQIRKIQGQYLSAIEDEDKAISLIEEGDEISND